MSQKTPASRAGRTPTHVPNMTAATEFVTQSVAALTATRPVSTQQGKLDKQSSAVNDSKGKKQAKSAVKVASQTAKAARDNSKKPPRTAHTEPPSNQTRPTKSKRTPSVATHTASSRKQDNAQGTPLSADAIPQKNSKDRPKRTRTSKSTPESTSAEPVRSRQSNVAEQPKKRPLRKTQQTRETSRAKPKTSKTKRPTGRKALVNRPTQKPPGSQSKSPQGPPITPPTDDYIIGFQGISYRPYRITAKDLFMSGAQQDHFMDILTRAKEKLIAEEAGRVTQIQQSDSNNVPDPLDQGANEGVFHNQLRTRDRESQLVRKINRAIDCLKTGSYGYCEACGCEIPIRRLEARPIVTKCIDCKERDELRERQLGQ